MNSFHRRNAENSFNAEDAEERRDAEDCSREESPSHNAPGFFWGRPLGRLLVASRAAVPKKEHGSWRADRSWCAVSASLPLCVLCVKAVGSFLNWCLTPILM